MSITAARRKALTRELELDGVHWAVSEGSILTAPTRAVVITIGIRLKSQGSWSNNWRAAAGRTKATRTRVMRALEMVTIEDVELHLGGHPQRVIFTRLAPRALDTDNNLAVFKAVRDQTCAWLAGRNELTTRANDGLRSGYDFSYFQQRQRAYGAQIELAREP